VDEGEEGGRVADPILTAGGEKHRLAPIHGLKKGGRRQQEISLFIRTLLNVMPKLPEGI
jgi:hypothetical protein